MRASPLTSHTRPPFSLSEHLPLYSPRPTASYLSAPRFPRPPSPSPPSTNPLDLPTARSRSGSPCRSPTGALVSYSPSLVVPYIGRCHGPPAPNLTSSSSLLPFLPPSAPPTPARHDHPSAFLSPRVVSRGMTLPVPPVSPLLPSSSTSTYTSPSPTLLLPLPSQHLIASSRPIYLRSVHLPPAPCPATLLCSQDQPFAPTRSTLRLSPRVLLPSSSSRFIHFGNVIPASASQRPVTRPSFGSPAYVAHLVHTSLLITRLVSMVPSSASPLASGGRSFISLVQHP